MAPTTQAATDAAASTVLTRPSPSPQVGLQPTTSPPPQVLAPAPAPARRRGPPSSSAAPSEAGDHDNARRRKKKAQKKKKSAKGSPEGPIIEELVSNSVDEVIASSSGAEKRSAAERSTLATDLKLKGNKAYGERKFVDAVKFYTRAIEVAPEPDPVFFSNRAASYMYFPTPEYEKAVDDCTEALRINPKHERSIGRRATALEKLDRFEEALRDFTAVTLLTRFADEKAAESVERVLKKITEPKARELFLNREPRLPPYTFVDAYFGAFRPRPSPPPPRGPLDG
ncbi:hypothetical protein EW145_g8326 [Phellinidium pouzarii]|uniref:Uncharacterized protein n=1 Tax=Phellinidium pouzarii TaxID=167371 RepID=A0A4S4KBG9_9AGAM|nr:hypothetical protein EW145_g8326 [Phellinidium pouzarii]